MKCDYLEFPKAGKMYWMTFGTNPRYKASCTPQACATKYIDDESGSALPALLELIKRVDYNSHLDFRICLEDSIGSVGS